MTVGEIIDRIGGNKAVQQLTKLSKGRISQWRTEDHIPRAWRLWLEKKRPSAFCASKRSPRRGPKEIRA